MSSCKYPPKFIKVVFRIFFLQQCSIRSRLLTGSRYFPKHQHQGSTTVHHKSLGHLAMWFSYDGRA